MASILPVAVVTGSNSGLGLALAIKLARNHIVFAGMRSLEKAGPLQEAAAQANVAENVRPIELDVNSDSSVEASLGTAIGSVGRVDVLINNAGYSQVGSVEFMDMDAMRAQMDTNLFGVIRCQKAVLPFMRQQKSGKIVNISSIGGIWGQPFNDIYCASKFAVEGLSESQAALFRTFGVRVTCVEPGGIKSSFLHNAVRPDMTKMPADYHGPIASTMKAYAAGSSSQTPDEVADSIIQQVIDVAEPPLRVQVNPAIQKVFETQLADVSGEAGVALSATRFLSTL